MIVYQTDNTGLYVGAIHLNNSDICPISGEFLIPGRCVKIKPPETPKDKVAYWKGSEWILEDVPKEPESIQPTPEEITAQRLNILDNRYQSQFAALAQALGLATLDNNEILIVELQAEYAELKQQYQNEREAILNG